MMKVTDKPEITRLFVSERPIVPWFQAAAKFDHCKAAGRLNGPCDKSDGAFKATNITIRIGMNTMMAQIDRISVIRGLLRL